MTEEPDIVTECMEELEECPVVTEDVLGELYLGMVDLDGEVPDFVDTRSDVVAMPHFSNSNVPLDNNRAVKDGNPASIDVSVTLVPSSTLLNGVSTNPAGADHAVCSGEEVAEKEEEEEEVEMIESDEGGEEVEVEEGEGEKAVAANYMLPRHLSFMTDGILSTVSAGLDGVASPPASIASSSQSKIHGGMGIIYGSSSASSRLGQSFSFGKGTEPAVTPPHQYMQLRRNNRRERGGIRIPSPAQVPEQPNLPDGTAQAEQQALPKEALKVDIDDVDVGIDMHTDKRGMEVREDEILTPWSVMETPLGEKQELNSRNSSYGKDGEAGKDGDDLVFPRTPPRRPASINPSIGTQTPPRLNTATPPSTHLTPQHWEQLRLRLDHVAQTMPAGWASRRLRSSTLTSTLPSFSISPSKIASLSSSRVDRDNPTEQTEQTAQTAQTAQTEYRPPPLHAAIRQVQASLQRAESLMPFQKPQHAYSHSQSTGMILGGQAETTRDGMVDEEGGRSLSLGVKTSFPAYVASPSPMLANRSHSLLARAKLSLEQSSF
jgi:hypothetical protein